MSDRYIYKTVINYLELGLALLLTTLVLVYASGPKSPGGVQQFLSQRLTVMHLAAAVVFIWAWDICFSELRAAHEYIKWSFRIARQILQGSAVMTVLLAVLMLATHARTSLWSVLPMFFASAAGLAVLHAAAEWGIDHWPRSSKWRVVILGTGPIARQAWRDIRTRRQASMEVAGFVDIGLSPAVLPEIRDRYMGNVSDLEEIVLSEVIDGVVVALPAKSCYDTIQRAIRVAEDAGVEVLHFDQIFRASTRHGSIRHTPGLWSYTRPCLRHAACRVFKRGMDLVCATLAVVALAPLMLAVAVAIKLTSKGPVFFIQDRYGYRRRTFKLLKFRTMVVNAESLMKELEQFNEAQGPIFKMKNDPRITPLGRFLRKTSLDELPQLFNVIAGSMSLVGPRPMSVRDVSLFSDAYLMRRFQVRPGITGLWQVSGRSNTTFDYWIAMDFRYIDNWSLLLDLRILLRTFPAVLRATGAM